ncbi:unnamed protein product [Phytophthora fragariaefolia]|uniref:Unnamed protein product n=1 Tax=Phytophthora fragariaefolia TaxID=1490495 RepID=A0A9W6TJP4_9STRA|nr:unnamed protein product [Phytophthora fragariaefolia]
MQQPHDGVNARDADGCTTLLSAAAAGSAEVVRFLAGECRADVDATDGDGNSALLRAAAEGHVEVVRCLVEDFGVDVDATNDAETSALMFAAATGSLELVRYLVEACGASVGAINAVGGSALMVAALRGHFEVARYLAGKSGADADDRSSPEASTLLRGAEEGRLDVVRCLAEECAVDVNAADGGGDTALMKAAAEGHLDVVRYLAGERQARVNVRNWTGATAIMFAAREGHVDVVQYLHKCQADVWVVDNTGATAFWMAAAQGRVDVVRCLAVESKSDVGRRTHAGSAALLHAASAGRVPVIRVLVEECKVDANATDKCNETALMKATANGHLCVVRYLAEKCGSDVNFASNTATTALMLAAQHGYFEIVSYLVEERAADVNATDFSGTTVLMIAAQYGNFDVVQYLAEVCGADTNTANKTGTTALMIAAQHGHIGVVRYLVEESRANVNAVNEDGFTAIRFAAECGHQAIQRFLTRYHIALQSEDRTMLTPNYTASNNDVPTWFIPPSEIALMAFVDTGNIGGEYRAKWLDADAAVKLFVPDASSHVEFEDEVHLWERLRHPNVIKMYGACDLSPLPVQFFVCESTSNGSLLEYVLSTSLLQQKVWSYLHQAALGLKYLHDRGIIHGDLRCSNILLGNDGLSKLANFARSSPTHTFCFGATSSRICSVRWQAPEVLRGEQMSFESDVYSLGMCALEGTTRQKPWGKKLTDYMVRDFKHKWTPEDENGNFCAPNCPFGDARSLIWRMCCQHPEKRITLSLVIHELERLAINNNVSPEYINFKTEIYAKNIQIPTVKCDNILYRQEVEELDKIHERLVSSVYPTSVFDNFCTLVTDFRQIVAMSSELSYILQISAACAATSSMISFRRRLQSLSLTLGESMDDVTQREGRWQRQHHKQIAIFICEVSKTNLLLEALKSKEERTVFLAFLKTEILHSGKYSLGQLKVLKKAYVGIASQLDSVDFLEMAPEWLIPWYELVIDKNNRLGCGGYGCVFRAKWLDSDVVVKRLICSGDEFDVSSSLSWYASIRATTSASSKREMMIMFRREVEIWFGFSHPHVVRLFGACHIGIPFFVCEYATNGTLVSYLRKNPHELWPLLHEAALGVQYLHARGVVHGDLKGNNIVIGSDKKAKVTDFGLSAITSDGVDPKLSGASHWVAPECFTDEYARPTFASDIYSFGMCIIEALRVAEVGNDTMKICLPWGILDSFVVKYHVKQKRLPPRPKNCTDHQWRLVERMCTYDPDKRLQISTVVDELRRLRDASCDHGVTTTSIVKKESFQEVVSAAREILALSEQVGNQDDTKLSRVLYRIHDVLWDELEWLHGQINQNVDSLGLTAFCALVDEGFENTKQLERTVMTMTFLAEITVRCYEVRRRLVKFAAAYFLEPACQVVDELRTEC